MRQDFSRQLQLDCVPISEVQLNLNCRDEMIPILRGIQHIYSQPHVREVILKLIASDVNANSREDRGRRGFSYWQIFVLAVVRLGCNFDYDKLQDLCEQHCNLRHFMFIGDWNDETSFHWRRIRDNIALLGEETIQKMNQAVVASGHQFIPAAIEKVRADSFVVETDIHYPTDSGQVADGLRKVITLMKDLSVTLGLPEWRQSDHLLEKLKRQAREIGRIASKKGKGYKNRLKKAYRELLKFARKITNRVDEQAEEIRRKTSPDLVGWHQYSQVLLFLRRTNHVMDIARRRVLQGETIPNRDKLFSIFEPHTQLYRRGKAGEENQFGRLLLVYEDAAGFVVHYHLMDRDEQDRDVAVEQSSLLQKRMEGKIESLSFDRGFHSPQNQIELEQIVDHLCLPKPGYKQAARQEQEADQEFRASKKRHSGIESAIGGLQSGNGLKRCRDRGEEGFERYIGLGILGRNLQTLGKLVIAEEAAQSKAAHSLRRPLAA